MRCQVKSKMKRGFITTLLVLGLVSVAYGADDSIGSETQESQSNIIRFLDKNKRGAAKITNTDNPSFNHLTATNTAAAGVATSGFKPTTTNIVQNPPAFKYLYNQQNYQANPYLTYIQIPQAAQIAAQYAFQSNPVAHYLQTPTQVQYVAAPTIAQIPQYKYQSFATANPSAAESSVSNSQYVAQTQQSAVSSVPQSSSTSSGSSQTKQAQVPLYSDYQTTQPVYYAQQPLFAYFPQAQAANYIYQQPNANYLYRQQQQQIANIYGANRFGLLSPTQNTQLTYLVPLVLPQSQQDSTTTTTTSNLKSSEKTSSNNQQQTTSSNSFSYGTKA